MDYDNIRSLTARMHKQIASGTFDAPSWDLIQLSRLAASIYAPLGTHMSLGNYVRVSRAFLEAFKTELLPEALADSGEPDLDDLTRDIEELVQLKTDLKVRFERFLNANLFSRSLRPFVFGRHIKLSYPG